MAVLVRPVVAAAEVEAALPLKVEQVFRLQAETILEVFSRLVSQFLWTGGTASRLGFPGTTGEPGITHSVYSKTSQSGIRPQAA